MLAVSRPASNISSDRRNWTKSGRGAQTLLPFFLQFPVSAKAKLNRGTFVNPKLLHFGDSRTPVVVVDNVAGEGLTAAREAAAALAPFPPSQTGYYPGIRRIITDADSKAFAYICGLLETVAPFIGGGFDAEGFDLTEASFSMVTRRPEQLVAAQRTPHFDSANPRYLAVLHYLNHTAGSGTAFYRQRSTGIERVDDRNIGHFIDAARSDGQQAQGFINGSNAHYEQIGAVECVADRLVIYPGCLLHSGIIPENMAFSDDPRVGRLTTNIFVMAR